jgi:hypothetical protein
MVFRSALTNIQQDCAVGPLVDNMVLEDFVVEGPRAGFSRGSISGRHRV